MNVTKERWLPIIGYEGLYEVSDLGRARSLDRTITTSDGRVRPIKGRILTPRPGKTGYLRASLSKGGVTRDYYLHRLVLEAFDRPCPDGMECCHWNDDRTDNRLENLRWASRSGNRYDSVRNGRHHHANKTHCDHGHEFTPENIITRPQGWRTCRTCHNDWIRNARLGGN